MRVALIGNIVGNAYIWSKFLRQEGLAVDLFLRWKELGAMGPAWEEGRSEPEGLPDWIKVYEKSPPQARTAAGKWAEFVTSGFGGREAVSVLENYDLIHSFTGSLFFSPLAIWRFGVRRVRPYVGCATGSDIKEAALRPGPRGAGLRLFFRRAARTLLLNIDMIDLPKTLGLTNAQFFPFLIDTDKYSPQPPAQECAEGDETLFFMPSHLDWGQTDSQPGRTSTKGNDRFIRALARFLKEGGRARAFILDRGTDREPARRLVAELGLSEKVTFLPEMDKQSLIEHYRLADVVADQFDMGAFGTTGLEAMSCGKPLLIHIDGDWAGRCYSTPPPVLYARSEDEILQRIREAADARLRDELGRQAREWIIDQHQGSKSAQRLIALYEEILAGRACN